MIFQTGLEILLEQPSLAKSWGRCGLVANQASLTSSFLPAWDALPQVLGAKLTTLFGPQHGFFGTKQDNMIETDHLAKGPHGLPVYSLYSETREPTEAMLANVDTLLIDLQIVGCRIYTWKATIAGCMRAAKKFGKKIVVLDRPNPVGGEQVEGRVLDNDCVSFVGEYPIPMRHGLTAAEAALFFNGFIKCDLEVVKLSGWDPRWYWRDIGRKWILTSPNLPSEDAVYVYPGTVIFEGVNISEGRGTSLPFQFIGAPYISSTSSFKSRVLELLGGEAPGVHLREAQFEPTAQKWAGKTCYGVHLVVKDPNRIRSLDLAIAIVRAAFEQSQNSSSRDVFAWKQPPYEYVHDVLPMKIIFGSRLTDEKFTNKDFSLHDKFWHEGITSYIEKAERVLLYDRKLCSPR